MFIFGKMSWGFLKKMENATGNLKSMGIEPRMTMMLGSGGGGIAQQSKGKSFLAQAEKFLSSARGNPDLMSRVSVGGTPATMLGGGGGGIAQQGRMMGGGGAGVRHVQFDDEPIGMTGGFGSKVKGFMSHIGGNGAGQQHMMGGGGAGQYHDMDWD
jgi:hypothetical protein